MPRTQVQRARVTKVCAVVISSDDDSICGRHKQKHEGGSAKSPITDHLYGGEDGNLIAERLPKCGSCQKIIESGEQYRKWKPRYRGTVVRCMAPACTPPRSYFTSSEILSQAWDIADKEVPTFESVEDFESWCEDVAGSIQEIVDLIQEKQDNIESGFGHTSLPVYEELDERRYMYEEWMEAASTAASNLDLSDESEESEDEIDLTELLMDAAAEVLGECPE